MNKFLRLLVFAFSISWNSFHAQTADSIKSPVEKKEKRVFVKFFYEPQYSYRSRSENEVSFGKGGMYDYGGSYGTSFTYDKSQEIPVFNWSAGIETEFILSKHLDLCIGFGFDRQGFKTKAQDLDIIYQSQGHYVWNDTIIHTPVVDQSLSFSYDFISRPIRLNFHFKKGKINYYAGVGFIRSKLAGHQFNFLTSSEFNYLLENSKLKKDQKRWKYFEATTFFSSVNIGVAMPIAKNLFLYIEPEFKMEIGSMADSPELWSAGCKAGIKF